MEIARDNFARSVEAPLVREMAIFFKTNKGTLSQDDSIKIIAKDIAQNALLYGQTHTYRKEYVEASHELLQSLL